MFLFYEYSSPVGRLLLGELRGSIVLCDWTESHRHPAHLRRLGIEKPLLSENPTSLLQEAILQLDQYFSAQRTTFTLPLEPQGTPFQRQVWQALLQVPYGTTITYLQLAQRLGMPQSVRAVANAVGANPISILVPCHRVVGSRGTLTGYAGGLPAKRHLLALEHPTYPITYR